MNNFINKDTKQLYTALNLQGMGVDSNNSRQLEALNLVPVTYAYPVFDQALYKIEPKPELKEVAGGFVQEFNIVDRDVDSAKAALKDRATAKRWNVETGGVDIDGIQIMSGIDDQNRIATAIGGMEAADMVETDFKAANGWVKVTLDQLKGIRIVLARHVEACFSRERALHEEIDACTSIEQLAAVDINAGWPSYGAE